MSGRKNVRSRRWNLTLAATGHCALLPGRAYARSLTDEVRAFGAHRLFRPPRTAASVRCSHCGAPHAAPPVMEELIQFICAHCGQSVAVEQPKIQ
jgi:hypothetical protein